MANEISTELVFKERISNNLKNQFMDLMSDDVLKAFTESAYDEFINGSANVKP